MLFILWSLQHLVSSYATTSSHLGTWALFVICPLIFLILILNLPAELELLSEMEDILALSNGDDVFSELGQPGAALALPNEEIPVNLKHAAEKPFRLPTLCWVEGSPGGATLEANLPVLVHNDDHDDDDMRLQFLFGIDSKGINDNPDIVLGCDCKLSDPGALTPVQDQCEVLGMKDERSQVDNSEPSQEDRTKWNCYEGASELVFAPCGAWDAPLSRVEKVRLALIFYEREAACKQERSAVESYAVANTFAHGFPSALDFPLSRGEKIERLMHSLN